MSVFQEVLDGIEAISKAIDNIGQIVDAVPAGQGYLEKRYKEAKEDVPLILEEIKKTLITTSPAKSIVTHIAFVDDPEKYSEDLRKFNDRLVDGKAEITALKLQIDEYRGHRSKIRHHADHLRQGSKLDHLFSIFGINSREENEKLSQHQEEI